ncbi:MAG: DUF424 family protein [Theionarchaea archaeon]|nr:MAG: hypothetical protein AYK18_10090 [Theionarchaea archaeon DG-70]MBU7013145.1 DUF424 family protein [Theionarchaea archaeon]
MDIYVRTIKTATEVLVAACDADLLGKTFEENDLTLEVKSDFYGGDCIALQACDHLFTEATILNLVGEKVVRKAVELGLVNPQNILKIGATVHAQMVRL